MQHIIKKEEAQKIVPNKKPQAKKEKIGRWSIAEAYLFESLLERYGKNWKKIHQHMKNRTLSQIRSHAQKYFDKVGSKKVQEFQRRAKLLEAYETLEKEKSFRENPSSSESPQSITPQHTVKQEQQSPLTSLESNAKSAELPIIKEQPVNYNHAQMSASQELVQVAPIFPFISSLPYGEGGYLLNIINLHPETFYRYQGIQGFIDNSAFRTYAPQIQ